MWIKERQLRLVLTLLAGTTLVLGGCNDHTPQGRTTGSTQPPAPKAAFSTQGDPQAGSDIDFIADDSPGVGLHYAWDFDDGSSASGKTVSHRFDSAGSYDVELKVTDDAGRSDSAQKSLDIQAAPAPGPNAAFSVSGTQKTGDPIQFDAGGSTGNQLVYRWSFDDGDAGNGARIAHVFDQADQYSVTLTVTDANGKQASASQTVDVSAGQQPVAADGEIGGTVSDTAGNPLTGVTVTLVNGTALAGGERSAQTDAQGTVSLSQMPTGIDFVLKLTKAGYAEQFVHTTIPDNASGASFAATMIARGAVQTLGDAENGGTVSGTDGASITLPGSALIDENGDPVSDDVDISVTPVDVSDTDQFGAFPGSFAAFDRNGDPGQLLSFGVSEFQLTQNGQELQLADGKQATLHIPIYASHDADGNALAEGDQIPFWSLDESTGEWVQEGVGTVIADNASPTGLAFEIRVGHFSWYNCDAFDGQPYEPIPQCKVDGSSGLPVLDTSETCYIQGELVGPNGPRSRVDTNIPGDGGVPLGVPANQDFKLQGTARNGTLHGEATVNGAAGQQEPIDIVLTPVDNGTGQSITLPYDGEDAIDPADETDIYSFTGVQGQVVRIHAGDNTGSNLQASVTLKDANGTTLASDSFTGDFDSAGEATLVTQLPADGTYSIFVSADANAPGGYELAAGIVPEVSIDQNLQGTVPDGGNKLLAFQGSANTLLGIQNVSSDEILAEVTDLDGNQILYNDAYQDPGFGELPADGIYLLRLHDRIINSSDGQYRTALITVPQPQPLNLDSAGRATASGNIQLFGDRQFFAFTASGGDGVYVSLDKPGGSSSLVSNSGDMLRIYRPGSNAFYAADALSPTDDEPQYGSSGDTSHLASLGLPLPGGGSPETYIVEVQAGSHNDGERMGAYKLRVDVAPQQSSLLVDDDLADCPSADTHSVRAAVYATFTGGNLDVCTGNYAEHLPVTVPDGLVQIVGRDQAGVKIGVSEPYTEVLDGNSDPSGGGVTLESLTIATAARQNNYSLSTEVGGLTDVTIEAADGVSDLPGPVVVYRDGAVIDGLTLTADDYALKINAPNVVVRNSTINGSPGQIDWDGASNAVFENNTLNLTDAYSAPLMFKNGGGLQFLNNQVTVAPRNANNYADSKTLFVADDGSGTSGALIRGNTFNTGLGGVYLNARDTGAAFTVERNRFQLTKSDGDQAVDAWVTNVNAVGSTNVVIQNNIIDGVQPYLGGLDFHSVDKFAEIDLLNNTLRTPNEDITNRSDASLIRFSVSSGFAGGATPVYLYNNILEGPNDPDADGRAVIVPDGTTVHADYNLFHEFGTVYVGSAMSPGANDMLDADPLFSNALLELTGSSPAIDAGTPGVSGGPAIPAEDYDGTARPQGASYDIGAHEYQP